MCVRERGKERIEARNVAEVSRPRERQGCRMRKKEKEKELS